MDKYLHSYQTLSTVIWLRCYWNQSIWMQLVIHALISVLDCLISASKRRHWYLFISLLFQLSQTVWPSHTIHQNFYDMYLANRSYERHYRALFERANDSSHRKELFEKVTKHFLAVHVYWESFIAVEMQDKPQLTPTSFMSQLGGSLNLWAGITVVVIIELIELCYEVVAGWFSQKSPGEGCELQEVRKGENRENSCRFWGIIESVWITSILA